MPGCADHSSYKERERATRILTRQLWAEKRRVTLIPGNSAPASRAHAGCRDSSRGTQDRGKAAPTQQPGARLLPGAQHRLPRMGPEPSD